MGLAPPRGLATLCTSHCMTCVCRCRGDPAAGVQDISQGAHQRGLARKGATAGQGASQSMHGRDKRRMIADQGREFRSGLGFLAQILGQASDQFRVQVEHGVGDDGVANRHPRMNLAGIDQTGLALRNDGIKMAGAQTIACATTHETDGVEVVVKMAREDMAAARDMAQFQTGPGSVKSDRWSVHGQTNNPDKGRPSWKKLPFS